jgi:hypothetical protein
MGELENSNRSTVLVDLRSTAQISLIQASMIFVERKNTHNTREVSISKEGKIIIIIININNINYLLHLLLDTLR